MSVISIPKVLRERLTEDGADALVDVINKADEKVKEGLIELVEEKFERRLAEEIGKVRAELIKWMFVFWVGQIAVQTGVLFAFFRK